MGNAERLDSELPAHHCADGSRIAIRYHEDNPPALAVRMQEMFGEATTPTIAQGACRWCWSRFPPPQAITNHTRFERLLERSDREVQKEMKGRHPNMSGRTTRQDTAPTRRTKKYS
ncbi:ATP-dependent helicase C-terminal domain-containing protein [Escherichia coli]